MLTTLRFERRVGSANGQSVVARQRLTTQLHEMGLHRKLCSISCEKTIFDGTFVRLWHLFASLPNSAESASASAATSSEVINLCFSESCRLDAEDGT
jgi:hypothetical protein